MSALLRAAGASRTVAKAMTQTRGYKVAVLGAAGGIGQPCGLLMKMVRGGPGPDNRPSPPRWNFRNRPARRTSAPIAPAESRARREFSARRT